MFQPRLDHPHVQITHLKHTEVKCTSSCIIFKIGSSIISNVPLNVFETIDDIIIIIIIIFIQL